MTTARAVWFERPGEASIVEAPLPALEVGEARVRALYTGLSAGTERKVLLGQVPASARAELTTPLMRGSFEFPISYGYAAVGEIEEAHPSVRDLEVGARVFALHPHHDRFDAPATMLRPLPRDVPATRQVLAANMETAITVVWDAMIELGDVVLIVGLGVVGLLITRLLHRGGAARVIAIDPIATRRELASRLGATEAHAALTPELVRSADVLIEATGSPAPLTALIADAAFGARVVIASFYGDAPVSVPLGGLFHTHRVSIQGSQVGTIPARKRDRWSYDRRFALVCEQLGDSALDALIAAPVPLSTAPSVYAALARGEALGDAQLVFDART